MHIRPEQTRDTDAIRALTTAAFGQPDEARLVDLLRADGDVAISLVCEQKRLTTNHITGHALFSPMNAPLRALGLAPVSVSPEHQKQGIGARLIRHGLDIAQADGWQAVFVLGDPGYYTRFGFSVAAAAGFISPYAGPCFMALELHPDALATPCALSYAAAFDTL